MESKCLFCGKDLSSEQQKRGNKFCGKSCVMKFRNGTAEDPDIFDISDTDTKYYLLGLVYADGNLSKDKSRITLSLTQKDVIESLYPYMCDTERRHVYAYKPQTYGNCNTAYTIINTNKESIQKLEAMGMAPCNSTTKPFPDIECQHMHSFLRGIFDADGSVYIASKMRGHLYLGASVTTGSEQFAKGLVEILNGMGMHPTIVLDSRRKQNAAKTFYVKLNRKREVRAFADYIYEDATMYIPYKYDRFYDKNIA